MDSDLVFIADRPKFEKVDEEWHTVVLTVENQELRVGLNGIKKTIVEAVTNTVGAKLVLGDPERKCKAFFGCIKDLVCLPRAQNSKEQKAHSFDLFDAAATRRDARAPTAAMFLTRSSQPE